MQALNMKASAPSVQRIKPITVRKVDILGETNWLIGIGWDAIRTAYPKRFYTAVEALNLFCESNNLTDNDIIVKYEMED